MSDELSRIGRARRSITATALLSPLAGIWPKPAWAGAQVEEPLANAVRSALAAAVSDSAPPKPQFDTMNARLAFLRWLGQMSTRLRKREAENLRRDEFLETAWYESTRAGLDPALLLGLIQVESGFRRYAISSAGARGYTPGDAVLGPPDRRWRPGAAVPHADQPALRLRDPAPLPRSRTRRPVPRTRPLQRQPGRPEYPNAVFASQRLWLYTPAAAA